MSGGCWLDGPLPPPHSDAQMERIFVMFFGLVAALYYFIIIYYVITSFRRIASWTGAIISSPLPPRPVMIEPSFQGSDQKLL